MTRYFTREEAEALLPEISDVLRRIQEGREQMRASEEELETLQVQAMGNGHHLFERITRLQSELAASVQSLRAAMNELLEFGCVLKDPDTGLIDFLSLRDGREVYLCWQLGEDRIRFWHDLDGGFAGRQPL
ncbi:MAG TPA: DUF2203 domain-containing protein [Ktedonobacteraceae bacterium]|nr:DUF2203 domain-containing protein [Ktedonobacteraceae bacterium]